MKRTLLASFLLFITAILSAQTNFGLGFKKGYQEGYCYGKSGGCISPTTPIPPIPAIGESSNSFTDGYNNGFVTGKNSADRMAATVSTNERQRYRAESVEHIERPIYNPSGTLLDLQIANALQLRDMKGQILQLISTGDYQQAMNLTNNGLSRAPRDSEFMLLKAQIFRSAGQLQNALEWYRKCARIGDIDGVENAIEATLKEMNSK